MSVFVFRINYDEDFQKVRQEILQGRLHQGWGADGMVRKRPLRRLKRRLKINAVSHLSGCCHSSR